MYATYNVHVTTHNLEFLQIFNSRQEAVDHLPKDAENHMSKYRSQPTRWIVKKDEMYQLPDGYFLRFSQKQPNRILSYEVRTSLLKGYFYNTRRRNITKLYIYGIIEIPQETIVRPIVPLLSNSHNLIDHQHHNGSLLKDNKMILYKEPESYINELKACLKSRRLAMTGQNPSHRNKINI